MSTAKHNRQRSFSFSGFDFQADLFPLSATVSEGEAPLRESPGAEKSISLIHGMCLSSFFTMLLNNRASGIGLVVGSQVCQFFVVGPY